MKVAKNKVFQWKQNTFGVWKTFLQFSLVEIAVPEWSFWESCKYSGHVIEQFYSYLQTMWKLKCIHRSQFEIPTSLEAIQKLNE